MGQSPAEIKLADKQIIYLASIGCTDEEIAQVAGVSERTLQRRCGALLKEGRATLRTRLRKAQLDSAFNGNATMLIWLGKQYLGQRDRHDVITTERDIRNLSDDELRAIAGLKD